MRDNPVAIGPSSFIHFSEVRSYFSSRGQRQSSFVVRLLRCFVAFAKIIRVESAMRGNSFETISERCSTKNFAMAPNNNIPTIQLSATVGKEVRHDDNKTEARTAGPRSVLRDLEEKSREKT